MDKDRSTFIHMQVKLSNTLGKYKTKMISLHAVYMYMCYVCTHACTQEYVRQVIVFGRVILSAMERNVTQNGNSPCNIAYLHSGKDSSRLGLSV